MHVRISIVAKYAEGGRKAFSCCPLVRLTSSAHLSVRSSHNLLCLAGFGSTSLLNVSATFFRLTDCLSRDNREDLAAVDGKSASDVDAERRSRLLWLKSELRFALMIRERADMLEMRGQ